jgi:hypothetical protein
MGGSHTFNRAPDQIQIRLGTLDDAPGDLAPTWEDEAARALARAGATASSLDRDRGGAPANATLPGARGLRRPPTSTADQDADVFAFIRIQAGYPILHRRRARRCAWIPPPAEPLPPAQLNLA